MSNNGIIFSAPMVRALLGGRKTQTRRLLKPAPYVDNMGNFCAPDRQGKIWNWGQHADGRPCTRNYAEKHVPFCIGDRLYVREANELHEENGSDIRRHVADGTKLQWSCRAQAAWIEEYSRKHCPSIHMPRWASRLWLAATDVRVQRLGHMSESDAIAEGVFNERCEGWTADGLDWFASPKIAFHNLWDSLHTVEGTTWEASPWVVAVTFEVHQGNIDSHS